MKNTRDGFTMIELIFVIVIIGILASVAIPKLSATRDDAKISTLITNARLLFGDINSFYTASGSSVWNDVNTTINEVTNVSVSGAGGCGTVDTTSPITSTWYMLCEEETLTSNPCIAFIPIGTLGGINQTWIVSIPGSEVCNTVASNPTIIAMAGEPGVGKIHNLSTAGVKR